MGCQSLGLFRFSSWLVVARSSAGGWFAGFSVSFSMGDHEVMETSISQPSGRVGPFPAGEESACMDGKVSGTNGKTSPEHGEIPKMRKGQWTACQLEISVSNYFQRAAAWQWWVALILALLVLPVVGFVMLLVRLTSRGPALYRQTRVGLHGRRFELIKVRTMRVDAEVGTGAVWTTSLRDPRITWVGRILRATHIDELPQLWNVLRGEMALVGPRPERPEFTGMLAESLPGYLERLSVLPGVTGLAQVNLPADTDLESVRKKLDLDLRYIADGSLALDLKIIACTAGRLLCIRSVLFRQWLGVAREPAEPSDGPPCSQGERDLQDSGQESDAATPEVVSALSARQRDGSTRDRSQVEEGDRTSPYRRSSAVARHFPR